jgi:hypothetical protein
MSMLGEDHRSACRRTRDEQIAAEPRLLPPDLPADAAGSSMEDHLTRHRLRPDGDPPDRHDEQLRQAVDYVLKKNAELYKRLA